MWQTTIIIMEVGMASSSGFVSGTGQKACTTRSYYAAAGLLFCLLFALLATPLLAAEDCISFDPNMVEAKNVNGNWTVVQGNMLMVNFGGSETNCRKAVEIIKHYKLNSQCFVGRPNPSFQYWLVNGKSPVGKFPGEDCIPFDPAKIEVKRINGRWKIVEGDHWLFDFDNSHAEAKDSLEIIKKYGFNNVCYVGRPNAPMQYLRKDLTLLAPPRLVTPLKPVKEDCISFNPDIVEAKNVNGNWTVVQGGMLMVNFGASEANCRKAVEIIKHYKMNSQCFVGRPNPSFQYWLVNGKSPVGKFDGEDCISFDPTKIEVKQINGRWKIVEGTHWMFDFESNEAEARTAFNIIKKYGFNNICYVGRPNAPMQYLRKDLKLAVPPVLMKPVKPVVPVVAEDCIATHPGLVKAQKINGTWKVVDGNEWVLDFGADGKADAEKAVAIIKHYGMTSHCYVGRPNAPFQYWLVKKKAPVGAFPGEDCIPFDPAKLEVKQVNGSWKIIEAPSHWMFDFGGNEDQARTGLAIIKKYGFTHTCYVGRPNAPMQYFRK